MLVSNSCVTNDANAAAENTQHLLFHVVSVGQESRHLAGWLCLRVSHEVTVKLLGGTVVSGDLTGTNRSTLEFTPVTEGSRLSEWASHDMTFPLNRSSQGRGAEPKMEAAAFYVLILDLIASLLSQGPGLAQCGRRGHSGVTTRRQGSLKGILQPPCERGILHPAL